MSRAAKPGWLARLFSAAPPTQPANILSLGLWPGAVYAVGDVHGCFDLYRSLEERLARDAEAAGGIGVLVVLGDFIDRGPQSAQMIDHFLAPPPDALMRIVLRGNHEEMFTKFLHAPKPGADWLRHGGRETLASYGIDAAAFETGALTPRRIRLALEATIPPEHRAFLADLPDALILDPYLFAHAGADPALPPDAQPPEVLRWDAGGASAALAKGGFALRLVHGHTPTADGLPLLAPERINLDTGAYASGTLTAARLGADGTVAVFAQRHRQ